MEMSHIRLHFFLVTFYILVITTDVFTYPISDIAADSEADTEVWRQGNDISKRTDVFMSRGWGAGGMPFNVLYTQKPKITRNSQVRSAAVTSLRPEAEAYYIEPQALRSVRQEPISYKYAGSNRRQYSVIPQLFVSYGWGPIGRK